MSKAYISKPIGHARVIADPESRVVAFITQGRLVLRKTMARSEAAARAVGRWGCAERLGDSAFYRRLNGAL